MGEWWREAAWMQWSDGRTWIHPLTGVESVGDDAVRLTAHKVAGFSVTLPANHPLAVAALSRGEF